MKIKSIKKIEYQGNVCNLRIADNHNYFAEDVLVSNCHTAKSTSIQSIAKSCRNADFRIGFTGTLPSELSEIYTIDGFIGPKIMDIHSDELIEKGILSKISIANILLKYPRETIELIHEHDYDFEVDYLLRYPKRFKILDWIFTNIPQEQNTLILCHLVDHVKKTVEYLKSILPNHTIHTIYGEIKPEERERIRKSIDNNEKVIIVATYATMSTGINIKKLHNVLFFSSYKSEIKIIQSIGRGLRTHEDKERLILWDIVDDLTFVDKLKSGPRKGQEVLRTNYLFDHFMERIKYYKEQGFQFFNKKINIENL